MFDQGMQNYDFDNNIYGNNNVIENDVDVNMMYGNGQMMQMQGGMLNNSVNEGVQERVVQRTFVHEVPHGCWESDN